MGCPAPTQNVSLYMYTHTHILYTDKKTNTHFLNSEIELTSRILVRDCGICTILQATIFLNSVLVQWNLTNFKYENSYLKNRNEGQLLTVQHVGIFLIPFCQKGSPDCLILPPTPPILSDLQGIYRQGSPGGGQLPDSGCSFLKQTFNQPSCLQPHLQPQIFQFLTFQGSCRVNCVDSRLSISQGFLFVCFCQIN